MTLSTDIRHTPPISSIHSEIYVGTLASSQTDASDTVMARNSETSDDIILTPVTPPQPANPPQNNFPQADFLKIASAACALGFKITPLRKAIPGDPNSGKLPLLKAWQKRPSNSPRQIAEWAAQFPNHNVGIVCKRFVGETISLDCDAGGVVEQIEKESGQSMPVTHIVQSRPQSAPWRRHFVFKQTAYSVKHLYKNINVKTVRESGDDDVTRYDVKCNNAQTVAAGSVRNTGEVYSSNGERPIPIPNWLVDWICQDVEKFKASKAMKAWEKDEGRARVKVPVHKGTEANEDPGNRTNSRSWTATSLVSAPDGRRYGVGWGPKLERNSQLPHSHFDGGFLHRLL